MMVRRSGVCPDSTWDEILRAVTFAHDRGYLYTTKKANTFVCGYRIPEVSEKWKTTIPENESGSIFFVNFAVSEEPNWTGLLKMLRRYLEHNTDVKEIVYFRRNSDTDFKRLHVRRNLPV